jgi:hypothetical protein
LTAAHAGEPQVAGIGGRYSNPQSCSKTCQFYNWMVEMWLESNRTCDGDQLALVGGNASYKRSVFDEGFRFDEALVYGGTETEFNNHLARNGHRLKLDERLAVIHNYSGTWRSLIWRAWKQGRGKSQNPHRATIKARKECRARLQGLETAPRPRFPFAAGLLLYYLLAQAGWLSARLSRVVR